MKRCAVLSLRKEVVRLKEPTCQNPGSSPFRRPLPSGARALDHCQHLGPMGPPPPGLVRTSPSHQTWLASQFDPAAAHGSVLWIWAAAAQHFLLGPLLELHLPSVPAGKDSVNLVLPPHHHQ